MTCIDDGCSTHHHISNAPHWRQIKKSHPEHSALRNSIEADWITPITPHGITEFFQTMAPQHPRMIQMKASVNGAGTKPGETRVSPPALPKFHVRDRGHHGVSKRRRWPLFIFFPGAASKSNISDRWTRRYMYPRETEKFLADAPEASESFKSMSSIPMTRRMLPALDSIMLRSRASRNVSDFSYRCKSSPLFFGTSYAD